MSLSNNTPTTPTTPPPAFKALIQSLAFDLAGLGFIGAGIYGAVTGKVNGDAQGSLFALGGAYLGLKSVGS